jgi:adenine-specific DNA-methyltransferase
VPTLEWIGKEKVINHHQDVPFRVLERKYSYDENGQHDEDNGSENMIIRGDNLEALKALLPKYEGRVKCIYIDPPYNTGNEGWVYNDNVNDPKIKKWLGEVVGKEGEDLSRHDKWLCMMYPRLKLLHKLLSDDGAIFISIDDNEYTNLKFICDEIFGSNCFVSNISWQRTYSARNDSKGIVNEVEHILVYSKKPAWNPKKLARTAEMDERYSSPDNDSKPWKSGDASAPGAITHPGMVYAIQHPITGKLLYPPNGRCWTFGQDQMLRIMCEWADYELKPLDDYDLRVSICGQSETVPAEIGAIMLTKPIEEVSPLSIVRYEQGTWPLLYFTSNGRGGIACKRYLEEMGGRIVTNLWPYEDVGHTDEAAKSLKAIFDGKTTFDTPKPYRLIDRILQIASDEDSVILDSFAGSGTTAHAVLNLNKETNGNRKFILIEMMDYAESTTSERVKRVISGFTQDKEDVLFDEEITIESLESGKELLKKAKDIAVAAKGKYSSVKKPKIEDGHLKVIAVTKGKDQVAGTGGNFSFYDLGDTLLLPDGNLNENVGEAKIRDYIWYTETKEPMTDTISADEPYCLGTSRDTAYYFYYKKDEITTLDYDFLSTVKTKAAGYIIYADLCTISDEELKKWNITFKKIPRDIAKV